MSEKIIDRFSLCNKIIGCDSAVKLTAYRSALIGLIRTVEKRDENSILVYEMPDGSVVLDCGQAADAWIRLARRRIVVEKGR